MTNTTESKLEAFQVGVESLCAISESSRAETLSVMHQVQEILSTIHMTQKKADDM